MVAEREAFVVVYFEFVRHVDLEPSDSILEKRTS